MGLYLLLLRCMAPYLLRQNAAFGCPAAQREAAIKALLGQEEADQQKKQSRREKKERQRAAKAASAAAAEQSHVWFAGPESIRNCHSTIPMISVMTSSLVCAVCSRYKQPCDSKKRLLLLLPQKQLMLLLVATCSRMKLRCAPVQCAAEILAKDVNPSACAELR